MDSDRLFLETLDDLARRVFGGVSDYEILMSAALLRKLLLDAEPLMDQVNRVHRLKIRFHAMKLDEYDQMVLAHGPVLFSQGDGLDPGTTPSASSGVAMTRDAFLGLTVMVVGGQHFTVRDVITTTAHILGAVHTGRPGTEQEKTLAAANAGFPRPGGIPVVVQNLPAIGRIVHRALQPLAGAVQTGET